MQKQRLANIELHLTPKQWAILMADEMRRYTSEVDFLKAIAKGTFRQSPYAAPLYALAQQVEEFGSGNGRGKRRAAIQLEQKLRDEFYAYRDLITNVNETIQNEAVWCREKCALRLSEFQFMIL